MADTAVIIPMLTCTPHPEKGVLVPHFPKGLGNLGTWRRHYAAVPTNMQHFFPYFQSWPDAGWLILRKYFTLRIRCLVIQHASIYIRCV